MATIPPPVAEVAVPNIPPQPVRFDSDIVVLYTNNLLTSAGTYTGQAVLGTTDADSDLGARSTAAGFQVHYTVSSSNGGDMRYRGQELKSGDTINFRNQDDRWYWDANHAKDDAPPQQVFLRYNANHIGAQRTNDWDNGFKNYEYQFTIQSATGKGVIHYGDVFYLTVGSDKKPVTWIGTTGDYINTMSGSEETGTNVAVQFFFVPYNKSCVRCDGITCGSSVGESMCLSSNDNRLYYQTTASDRIECDSLCQAQFQVCLADFMKKLGTLRPDTTPTGLDNTIATMKNFYLWSHTPSTFPQKYSGDTWSVKEVNKLKSDECVITIQGASSGEATLKGAWQNFNLIVGRASPVSNVYIIFSRDLIQTMYDTYLQNSDSSACMRSCCIIPDPSSEDFKKNCGDYTSNTSQKCKDYYNSLCSAPTTRDECACYPTYLYTDDEKDSTSYQGYEYLKGKDSQFVSDFALRKCILPKCQSSVAFAPGDQLQACPKICQQILSTKAGEYSEVNINDVNMHLTCGGDGITLKPADGKPDGKEGGDKKPSTDGKKPDTDTKPSDNNPKTDDGSTTTKKSNTTLMIGLVAGGVALLVILVMVGMLMSSSPKKSKK